MSQNHYQYQNKDLGLERRAFSGFYFVLFYFIFINYVVSKVTCSKQASEQGGTSPFLIQFSFRHSISPSASLSPQILPGYLFTPPAPPSALYSVTIPSILSISHLCKFYLSPVPLAFVQLATWAGASPCF